MKQRVDVFEDGTISVVQETSGLQIQASNGSPLVESHELIDEYEGLLNQVNSRTKLEEFTGKLQAASGNLSTMLPGVSVHTQSAQERAEDLRKVTDHQSKPGQNRQA